MGFGLNRPEPDPTRLVSIDSCPPGPCRSDSMRFLSYNLAHSLTDVNPNLLLTQKAHAQLLRSGIPVQESNLVHEYCNRSAYQYARKLFEETPNWDVVSATAVIGAFAGRGLHQDAVSILPRLLSLSIRPNEFTFGATLHSSIALADLNVGRQLHAVAAKLGLGSNVFVGSSLVHMYAKLGSIEESQCAFEDTREPNVVSFTALFSGYLKNGRFDTAVKLFYEMPERNVVSWNAMIGGCSQVGFSEESVNLYVEMCREGFRPNQSTFSSVSTAAANIAALGIGRSFHACAIKYLGKLDVFVANSLISFYAKCGSLEDSVLAFERLEGKNIVSWNAVICGFAQNGRGDKALACYKRMRRLGLKPNDVTLLSVLFGCSHAGLVDEGYACFNVAKAEQPDILRAEHYACVVDLLSRSRRFGEAESFLQELPFEPGIGFWKALLGGSQLRSNKQLAESVANQILALDPKDISSYVLLSNVYSAAGNWQSVSMVRREMKGKGMKRTPGCSWIEIRNKVHVFTTGDRRHAQTDEIYMVLATFLDI